MTTDYGTDLATPPGPGGALDITPDFTFETDPHRLLAEAVARGLDTIPGSLWWAPEEGVGVRTWLNERFTPARVAQLQRAVVVQCLRDERILSARAGVTFSAAASALAIAVEGDAADGPFAFVFDVSQAAVRIVSVS